MKRVQIEIALVALLAVALAPAISTAQTAKPKPSPKVAPKSPPANQGDAPKPLEFGDVGPDFDMPDPWPAPSPRPDMPDGNAAMTLARTVLEGGPKALPALERAALESGLSIRNEDGQIIFAADPKRSLGLAISDLELAAAAYVTAGRSPSPLSEFNGVCATNPALKDLDLAKLLSQSLASCGNSTHPGKLFFCTFVAGLGLHSNGDFAMALDIQSDNQICSAQRVWLAYLAAGQMAAATQPPPPFFQAPTAHGPRLFDPFSPTQGRLAALNDLATISRNLGAEAIANAVRQNLTQGISPEETMLEMAQNELLRAGTKLTGTLNNSPLIRTKKKGQTGGKSNLDLRLDFRLSTKVRSKFARAAQQLHAIAPLPPNGPLGNRSLVVHMNSGPVHYNSPTGQFPPSSTGRFRIALEGDTQTNDYSNDAIPVPTEAEIFVAAYQSGNISSEWTEREFKIPVRDWAEPGVVLSFEIQASGHDSTPKPDGSSFYWNSFRYVFGNVRLTRQNIVAYIEDANGQIPRDFNRFTTSMTDPINAPAVVKQELCDVTVTRNIMPGCDGEGYETRTGQTSSHKREPKSRVLGPPGEMAMFYFQADSKDKNYSVKLDANHKVDVTISGTNMQPVDTEMDLFRGIVFEPDQRMSLPTHLWKITATPFPDPLMPPGTTTYYYRFGTRARHAGFDEPGKKSMNVAGFIRVDQIGRSGTLSESEAKRAVFNWLTSLSSPTRKFWGQADVSVH